MRSIVKESVFAFASFGITLGLVAFADPANASATSSRMTDHGVVVQIDDLDLHSQAGRAMAERRIRGAAALACGLTDVRDLQAYRCRSEAIASASRALDERAAAL
jgi:UrcA family protein